MTDFIGGITLAIEDSPAASGTFSLIPGLTTPPTVGKTNPLVDVTDFDSTAKEYIAGLADGSEMSATFHYDADSATNPELVQLRTLVDDGEKWNFQVVVTDGTNTDTYDFAAAGLSWQINGGPEEVATIDFTLKISGAITLTSTP